jgi:hypothetical protein
MEFDCLMINSYKVPKSSFRLWGLGFSHIMA